jgi:hypothetical protein
VAVESARQDEAKPGGAAQCFLTSEEIFIFLLNLFDRRENLP